MENYNAHNIALVRATDVVPVDGIIHTISSSRYLVKRRIPFASVINGLLDENGYLPEIDYNDLEKDMFVRRQILDRYLPYISDYNSCVLFSLNGIVPDDYENGFGGTEFSLKNCAIILPLMKYIDKVVSLNPTDTVLVGDIPLDKEAIVLIKKNYYDSLRNEDKELLNKNIVNLKLFEGSIKEAVYIELKNSGKYMPEELTLSRGGQDFKESKTSALTKEIIDDIAVNYKKEKILYFDLLRGWSENQETKEFFESELDNVYLVDDYYLKMFFKELFKELNVPLNYYEELNTTKFSEDFSFMKLVGQKIKEYGIDKYQKFVENYNNHLLELQRNGELLTPEEIITQVKKQKNIS